MANTYTKLYIQIVFAVQDRQNLIQKSWKNDLNKYISGTISGLGHKSINVNGMPDHIHTFVGLHPSIAISDLVREIKTSSSLFINQHKLIYGKFNWQAGYGAFSYSQSQIKQVYDYIDNQEIHHKKKTFKDEYLGLQECRPAGATRMPLLRSSNTRTSYLDKNDAPMGLESMTAMRLNGSKPH